MEKAIFRTLYFVLILLTLPAFSQSGETITGTLLYHNISPMSNVSVYLLNSSEDTVATTITNGSGNYTFPNVAYGDYSISFHNPAPAGGVTLTDAYTVMLYLFGMYQFNPIKFLAADVNASGTITWTDYNIILISYLNQGNPFPIGPWVFEPVSLTVGSRNGPISSGGSSSGDANGNFVPTKEGNYIYQEIYTEDQCIAYSKDLQLAINSPDEVGIGGMHLALTIPEGISVTNVESPLEGVHYTITGQELRITWLDNTMMGYTMSSRMPLVTVNARIDHPSREERSYTLDLLRNSHFIGFNGEMLSGVHITLPTINLIVENEVVLNTYPNPFFEQAMLEFQSPAEGKLTIMLYDNTGRLIREVENGIIPEGKHSSQIDGTSLKPGIYYYNLNFEGPVSYIKTGTIIKSK